MVTRRRDLDAFAYANARDVWWIEDDGGLAFALIGMRSERRAVVPAIYGGLTLQNGVPVGYHQCDLVGRSAAISFNTFETFRGGEAAHTFARLLAALAHGFGTRSFSIEPYQLGKGNDEGLASGAWWFYAKLGFRPRARDGMTLARREFARLARSKSHRTRPDTLRALAEHHLFLDLDAKRPGTARHAGGHRTGGRASPDAARRQRPGRRASRRPAPTPCSRCGLASLEVSPPRSDARGRRGRQCSRCCRSRIGASPSVRRWCGWSARRPRTRSATTCFGFAALPRLEHALAHLAVRRSG